MPEDLILPTDMLDAPASNDAAYFVDSLDAAWDNIEAPPESKTPTEPAPKTEEPAKTAAIEKSADDLIAEAEKGLEEGKSPRAPHWKVLKDKAAQYEKEVAELRKQLEAKGLTPAEDPEKPLLKKELEELKKQHEEYEREIKAVRVESSKEFREAVIVPGQQIRDAATALAERNDLAVDDIRRAFANPDVKARNEALSSLASNLNEVERMELYTLARDFVTVSNKRSQLLANSESAYQELEARRVEAEQQAKSKTLESWKSAAPNVWERMVQKAPMLKDIEGADAILNTVSSIDPANIPVAEQAYNSVSGRLLPPLIKSLKAQQLKVAELETALKGYQTSTPAAGPGTGASPAQPMDDDPDEDWATAFDRKASKL
jgi:hypothetical protein